MCFGTLILLAFIWALCMSLYWGGAKESIKTLQFKKVD